jgi:sortase A
VVQPPTIDSTHDDLGLLQELLAAPPPVRSSLHRPAQLRSLKEERKTALQGYRFRGVLDAILVRSERLLIVGVIIFFGYWVVNIYGRDWWYARNNPAAPSVVWESLAPGASAAELDRVLGQQLPVIAPAISAAAPDYLVPAQAFILPPASPTPTPDPMSFIPKRIIVPTMELDSPVREVFLRDGIWEVADYAVGYHHGTALPGKGNSVFAGHAGIRGSVFARLNELQIGQDIYVETADTRYHYQVQTIQQVWPNQVEVMYPTEQAIITMITCTAWDTQRLVVKARLIDQAALSS